MKKVNAAMNVFLVQHAYDDEGEEEVKIIGIYSTQEKAEQAVERLRLQPGFRDMPESFCIDKYAVDEDNWAEGYIKM